MVIGAGPRLTIWSATRRSEHAGEFSRRPASVIALTRRLVTAPHMGGRWSTPTRRRPSRRRSWRSMQTRIARGRLAASDEIPAADFFVRLPAPPAFSLTRILTASGYPSSGRGWVVPVREVPPGRAGLGDQSAWPRWSAVQRVRRRGPDRAPPTWARIAAERHGAEEERRGRGAGQPGRACAPRQPAGGRGHNPPETCTATPDYRAAPWPGC